MLSSYLGGWNQAWQVLSFKSSTYTNFPMYFPCSRCSVIPIPTHLQILKQHACIVKIAVNTTGGCEKLQSKAGRLNDVVAVEWVLVLGVLACRDKLGQGLRNLFVLEIGEQVYCIVCSRQLDCTIYSQLLMLLGDKAFNAPCLSIVVYCETSPVTRSMPLCGRSCYSSSEVQFIQLSASQKCQ